MSTSKQEINIYGRLPLLVGFLILVGLLFVFLPQPVAQERAFRFGEAGEFAAVDAIAVTPLVPEEPTTIKVYESTFNEFTSSIQPITVTGHYKFTVTIDTFIFGKRTITICDSNYSADVTDLDFEIETSGVQVDGDVDAEWCGLSFSSSTLNANGTIAYSSGDESVHFTFYSTTVQPCFTVKIPVLGDRTVCLPASINIASTLNIPPLPIRTTALSFETAGGPRTIYLEPRDVSLRQRNGYIELQSYVSLW